MSPFNPRHRVHVSPTVIVLIGLVILLGAFIASDIGGGDRADDVGKTAARELEQARQEAAAVLLQNQRKGCRRGKASNRENARGWALQARGWETERGYKLGVTRQASVKADVKALAAKAAAEYWRVARGQRKVARSLRKRSMIDCVKQYPTPTATPSPSPGQ